MKNEDDQPRVDGALRLLSERWRKETETGTPWDDGYVSGLGHCADELDAFLVGEHEKTAVPASESFDARDWGREFIQEMAVDPSIATDERRMTNWFASALMRGYDEARR